MHRILEKAIGTCLGMTFFLIILWIMLLMVYWIYGKTLFPVKFNRIRRVMKERETATEAQTAA